MNYVALLFIAVSLAYLIASYALDPKSVYDVTDPTRDWDSIERMFISYNISDSVPIWERYRIWLTKIFTEWDWGMTPTGASVNSIISVRIWVSLRLILIGSLVGMVGGVAVGAWTATKQYSKTDRIVSILSLIIISTPVIVLANLLQVGAIQFNGMTGTQFFEFTGETGAHGDYFGAAFFDRLQHLLLPTISMSLMGIARALALNPKLIILDEPVSALDVSIQAGIVNLLEALRVKLGLSYMFVAHDLSVVRHIADRVAVMYLGKIVEIGEVSQVFDHPRHPYTQALLSAIPIPDPQKERKRNRILLEGDLPSPANPPTGCRFHTRCQKFKLLSSEQQKRCKDVQPKLQFAGGVDSQNACHYPESVHVF